MKLGIGLPNAVAGTTGAQLRDFAKAADDAGFSSLGTIDRIAYGNFEPLMALSAAAAVTERIGLATTVMLGPLRGNAALVAKQVLSLDAIAGGGRATLGIAIGQREDDYEISGVPLSERGAWLDAGLEKIRKVWAGDGENEAKVGPPQTNGGPSLVVGGTVDAAFERAARWGDGWIMGGGPPDYFAESMPKLDAAWEKAGRDGEPRRMALGYFSLGESARENADDYLKTYYAWLGDEVAGMIASSAVTDADGVKERMAAFEEAGVGELILFPSSGDPEQVELLAQAAGL